MKILTTNLLQFLKNTRSLKFSVTFKGRGLVTAKMFTKEDKLPTLEELEVPEVTMGSTWLRAGKIVVFKSC